MHPWGDAPDSSPRPSSMPRSTLHAAPPFVLSLKFASFLPLISCPLLFSTAQAPSSDFRPSTPCRGPAQQPSLPLSLDPTRSSHPRVAFTLPTPLTPRPLSAASCLCRCVRHHPRRTALARSVLSGTHVTYARRQLEVLTARLAGLAMQRALPAPALRLARHVGCLAAGSSAFLTRRRRIVSFIAPLQRCSSDQGPTSSCRPVARWRHNWRWLHTAESVSAEPESPGQSSL